MQIIKSDIIQTPCWDRIQGHPIRDDVRQDIINSLKHKIEHLISLDNYITIDDTNSRFDECRAALVILSVDEYEKLKESNCTQ